MKKSTTLIVLLALAAPSCQSNMHRQMLEDQDQQLAAYKTDSDNLRLERDRIRAENAALSDQLGFEQERNLDLSNRVEIANAAAQKQNAEVQDLQARLAGSGVDVESRGGYIVLGLPSNLSFGSGKAELNKKGKETMTLVAGILKTDYQGKTFWVEGHTDSDQPKKSGWSSNLALSVNRALSVADFLVFDQEIESQFVRIAGHGEFSPKDDNGTKEGKANNRRVEILVLP
ncbi:MAG: OmpA/MotB family protein [Planctomycetota bacterium]|jgi:chemotaxis protein MotB